MAIDLRATTYVPTIFLRAAELLAVKQLPDSAKDKLTPIFCLKPWKTAKLLSSAMGQISKSFGNRKFFLDIDPFVEITEVKRPAQEEYLNLISSDNGNQNWIEFFNMHENAYPCIIVNHGKIQAIQHQVKAFSEREKFFLVRLNISNSIDFDGITDAVCQVEHANFGFVIDVGWSRDLMGRAVWADARIKRIVAGKGDSVPIILTGSSFPDSFDGFALGDQVEVRERVFFDQLKAINNVARLVYGDWASSRSPTEGGGGNPIPPRIELATARNWEIYRLKEDKGGFRQAALSAQKSPNFKKTAGIWPNYMIEATALGDPNGISSQQMSAAVRINMHLYQQLYFDEPGLPPDSDDEYVD
jgi:Beta protein